MMNIYPDEKIEVPVYVLCTTIMAVPICFIAETNLSAWTLRPDITLAATVLSVRNYVMAYIIQQLMVYIYIYILNKLRIFFFIFRDFLVHPSARLSTHGACA